MTMLSSLNNSEIEKIERDTEEINERNYGIISSFCAGRSWSLLFKKDFLVCKGGDLQIRTLNIFQRAIRKLGWGYKEIRKEPVKNFLEFNHYGIFRCFNTYSKNQESEEGHIRHQFYRGQLYYTLKNMEKRPLSFVNLETFNVSYADLKGDSIFSRGDLNKRIPRDCEGNLLDKFQHLSAYEDVN